MLLPLLTLRTWAGAPYSLRTHWQRHNLLLLFAHPGCPACRRVLEDWDGQQEALGAASTVALAVYERDPARPAHHVETLLDPSGRLAAQLGVGPGTAVATDRFFEILAREDVHGLGPDRAAFDAIAWIDLAERRCDECGVPTW